MIRHPWRCASSSDLISRIPPPALPLIRTSTRLRNSKKITYEVIWNEGFSKRSSRQHGRKIGYPHRHERLSRQPGKTSCNSGMRAYESPDNAGHSSAQQSSRTPGLRVPAAGGTRPYGTGTEETWQCLGEHSAWRCVGQAFRDRSRWMHFTCFNRSFSSSPSDPDRPIARTASRD